MRGEGSLDSTYEDNYEVVIYEILSYILLALGVILLPCILGVHKGALVKKPIEVDFTLFKPGFYKLICYLREGLAIIYFCLWEWEIKLSVDTMVILSGFVKVLIG